MAPKRATRSTRATTTPAPTATTTTNVTNAQLQAMIDQGVSAALAARDATRNGTDSHSSGTGVRGSERIARECTYQDFMKCKPLYFKGTEGVVELTQWFERMETVFRISNCSAENQIKFSTCTLLAGALTWWNTHVMTVTHDVAYSMTWVCRWIARHDPLETVYVQGKNHARWLLKSTMNLLDKKSVLLLKRQAKNSKEELKTLPENNQNQQQHNKKEGRTPQGYTLLDRVIRNNMGDLDPYAQNAITTMTVRVLQSAINATNMVTSPVTIGVREIIWPQQYQPKGNRIRSGDLLCFECGVSGTLQEGMSKDKNNKGNRVINWNTGLLSEGLAGYYWRFIEGFSKIVKPMTKLTQKKVKFVWGSFSTVEAEIVQFTNPCLT
ncbi:hypothetical protein Tco_0213384 [Tanacetum coccineum]